MKDIEKMLADSSLQPRRELRANFTRTTTNYLAAHPRPKAWREHLQEIWNMKLAHKPAGIALGILLATASIGTVAAVANGWLDPNAKVDRGSGITKLANGNIRVWINADACQGQSMTSKLHSYYEIKAGSNVTPEKLADKLNFECESDMLTQLFPEITALYGKTKDNSQYTFTPYSKQYFTPFVTFVSADPGGMVVDTGLNGVKYNHVHIAVAQDAHFYYMGERVSLKDLKPGTLLTLVTQTSALDKPYATETMRPEELSTLSKDGFPIGATVVGAIQHKYPAESETSLDPSSYTRLEADQTAPDGWRQISPLN